MKNKYYFGVDENNKLIISDKPVITATNGKSGSFDKDLSLNNSEEQPWHLYANDITSIEVQGKVAPVSTARWFANLKMFKTWI